jgi:hypothetical protein
VAHGLPLVAGNPSPHRHRRHHREVEANNSSIKHIKRTGHGSPTPNYKTRILLRSAARTAV